ncbi:MAG: hypothetical protein IPH72_15935 [Sandaracinaceae bacterium]|nr:hypothetical protein [Sandaracinaceae bacterium]
MCAASHRRRAAALRRYPSISSGCPSPPRPCPGSFNHQRANLIDGLTALAGGSRFACVGNSLRGNDRRRLYGDAGSATLAGAIVGFLVFNFNPASIFQRATRGSMFPGSCWRPRRLGRIGQEHHRGGHRGAHHGAGAPIADTAIAMLRRAIGHGRTATADRGAHPSSTVDPGSPIAGPCSRPTACAALHRGRRGGAAGARARDHRGARAVRHRWRA